MGHLQPGDDTRDVPKLRREVIIPKARDALAFHRRIAVLSIFVALLAGSLDAMLWREARRDARRAHIEAQLAAERAERAALDARDDERPSRVEMPVQRTTDGPARRHSHDQ